MECKEVFTAINSIMSCGINRNIMECKGARTSATLFSGLVLIETLWNVKKHTPHDCRHTFSVLIETLWNVKPFPLACPKYSLSCINRNIMECKVK